MPHILDRIEHYKLREIADAKVRMPRSSLERQIEMRQPPRGFVKAMRNKLTEGRMALIAEIKKASPSKGLIRADFSPDDLARAYFKGGAACLSVLTDTPSFQGKPEYIAQAHEACTLPILRKDFLYDPYQVYEARAWGADCILIIMAAVDDARAKALNAAAHDLKLDVLVEVHDEEQLKRALLLETPMIGINNRNLQSFDVSLKVTEEIARLIPKDRIIVSESGIGTHEDCKHLRAFGVSSFLVGESLMRHSDVANATHRLLTNVDLA